MTSSITDTNMRPHNISSQYFEQDPELTLRMADERPVMIIAGGRPSHVLLSWADYRHLVDGRQNLVAKLGAPELSDIELEPEKTHVVPRKVDFS